AVQAGCGCPSRPGRPFRRRAGKDRGATPKHAQAGETLEGREPQQSPVTPAASRCTGTPPTKGFSAMAENEKLLACEKLLAWGDRLKAIVEEDLQSRFRAFGQIPYTEAAPGERLDALLHTWCALCDEDSSDPVGARAERFKQHITMLAHSTATAFENILL